ncbi:MAG: insulinase family protein, partial [Oscillospiraceae bacterium]|nr:insulinase family protein [Oscillospiraceae bacterium]
QREDSAMRLEDAIIGQAATGIWEGAQELIAQLRSVTAERIAAAARSMTLDTVYFLRGEEETENA